MTWWWLCVYLVGGWSGLAAGVVFLAARRIRRTRARPVGPGEVIGVARVMAVAVAGGANLVQGWTLAAELAPDGIRPDIELLLRRARADGLAVSMGATTGPLAVLAMRLARAQLTGASLAPVLDGFITATEDQQRARLVERIRTLPVRLIVPLAILLLPGFVLVAVAPGVVEALSDLFEGLQP